MMQTAPPKTEVVRKVFALTEVEVEAGVFQRYYAFEEMNAKYGEGSWRALNRYAICQGTKWRL